MSITFHHAVLSNGLTVIAELNDQVRSIATGFFVRTGRRDENPAQAGVSHFLEHMVFKGTDRRDALQVNRDFDRVGARHNAQTSEEDTVFHVTCLPEYLATAFDVLSDILRPQLRAEDFETEKEVIIEEIQMYLDNPMMVAYEAAKAAHFGDHPLGISVLGSEQTVRGLTIEQMHDYFKERYSPKNMVLAFTGNGQWDRLVDLAERKCGHWQGDASGREARRAHGLHGFQALLRAEDNQMTVVGVTDAPCVESSDRHASALLTVVLGDSTNSRLYWELIDPGHADGVDLSFQDYNQSGAYYTFLSCEPEGIQANLERIAEVYRQVTAEPPSEDELARAKNKVLARSVLRSERPMGRLMPLGFTWTYLHRYMSLEEEMGRIEAVTRDDLARVLREWPLLPMTLVTAGPTTDVKPLGA